MKHLTRVSWLLVVIYTCALPALAQESSSFGNAEFGTLAEIKDKHKVYVERANFNAHEILLKEVAKDRSLVIVSRPEAADFLLAYDVDFLDLGNNQRALSGQLVVFTLVEDPSTKDLRPRVLWAAPKHKVFIT